jgi:hypothetical protein
VVKCGSKSIYQKDTCFKETKVCAQNMIATLGSMINIILGGRLYDHLMSTIFHFDNE